MRQKDRKPRSRAKKVPDTRSEFLALAKSYGIKGRHRMTKKELIQALEPYLKREEVLPIQGERVETAYKAHETQVKKRYADLPWSYGETELVLMPVDPFLIFAYWDFSPEDWKVIYQERDSVLLRIYDVTMIHFDGKNAHSYFDLPVTPESQSWYIHLWSADKSICAGLGWLLPDGSFHAIARSNVIQTPRAGISILQESRWIKVHYNIRRSARRKSPRLMVIAAVKDQPKKRRSTVWTYLEHEAADLTQGEIRSLSSESVFKMTKRG